MMYAEYPNHLVGRAAREFVNNFNKSHDFTLCEEFTKTHAVTINGNWKRIDKNGVVRGVTIISFGCPVVANIVIERE